MQNQSVPSITDIGDKHRDKHDKQVRVTNRACLLSVSAGAAAVQHQQGNQHQNASNQLPELQRLQHEHGNNLLLSVVQHPDRTATSKKQPHDQQQLGSANTPGHIAVSLASKQPVSRHE